MQFFPEALQATEVDGVPLAPLYEDGLRNPLADRGHRARLSHEAMTRAAQLLWDHNHHPFTLITAIEEDLSVLKDDSMELSPGDIVRERLADYVRARGYDKHTLHGTLGKMLDVISVTAGVVHKDAVDDRRFSGELISKDELEEMMRSSGVGDRARRDIDAKLNNAVIGQLTTSQPFAYGEIVLEGVRDWWKYDRVALSSLSALAGNYRGKRSQAALFLRQFI